MTSKWGKTILAWWPAWRRKRRTSVRGSRINWEFFLSRRFGLIVALAALAIVLFYVFVICPYERFRFSDMDRYWRSAMNRLAGEEFRDSQFIAWPPIYHIFLAEMFRVLRWLGLESWIRIETAMTLNIVAFAGSVYALQRLAVQWFTRPPFVLVTVLIYAFGFPSLYFNAFLLSGNLGVPLMIAATAMVACRTSWTSTIVGAGLLAVAVAIRPSFGPYGAAFVALYLVRHGFSNTFIARAAAFSAIFFAVVFLASAEVSRISHGRVNGLSANGGVDFFIASSHYHRTELNYDGWHFSVVVPGLSFKPENGTYYTNVPFYNQKHYFKLGWDFIKQDPTVLLRNVGHVGNLFFADMLPSRYDAPGFATLRPVWDWFKFGMFVTLGLYAWMWRGLRTQRPLAALLLSMIGLTLLVSFFFTGEPRYTYSILFAFYLLFFKLVEMLLRNWQLWRRAVFIYAGLLLLVTVTVSAANRLLTPTYPASVSIVVTPGEYVKNGEKIERLPERKFEVGRILFPHERNPPLVHADLTELTLDRPARVRLRTRMEVLSAEPMTIQFEVYTGWASELVVDRISMMQNGEPADYVNELAIPTPLTPGMHDLELKFDFLPKSGGYAVGYSYWENGWRERQMVGADTARVRFHKIDSQTVQP